MIVSILKQVVIYLIAQVSILADINQYLIDELSFYFRMINI